MCLDCGDIAGRQSYLPRRSVLKFAAAFAAGAAFPRLAFGKEPVVPPKAENVVSPDVALQRLMAGNRRYVDGVARRHDFEHEREALTRGQNPIAGILSCADSRVAPEYAFDTGRGDLFVCRLAGNFANDDVIASFEYAVQNLNTPLLMVLGHTACGAIDAAVKSVRDGVALPGHLSSLVTGLTPAVKAALDQPGPTVELAVKQNVILNVERLKRATPIISQFVEAKKVRVVGAIYHLDSGRIEPTGDA
ncbi:MAG: carbonic anhydrase [Xanthobacteraceae bacterium]